MKELITVTQRSWPGEILVEPSRLEMPIWGNPEGDIQAAYCADTFPKIRTFVHDSQLFTNCGGCAEHSMDCYPLVLELEYHGPEPHQYSYEGRAATFRGRNFKLGPKVKFTSRPRSLEEWADLLRRQYAHGGYFAAGKTYRDVLHYFRENPRLPKDEHHAVETELAMPDLPLTQGEMLERIQNLHYSHANAATKSDAFQLTLAGM